MILALDGVRAAVVRCSQGMVETMLCAAAHVKHISAKVCEVAAPECCLLAGSCHIAADHFQAYTQ